MSRTKLKSAAKHSTHGQEIIDGLRQVVETLQRGEPLSSRFTVRTVVVPDKPNRYDAAAIRRTRDLVGASQPIFAMLLGVSASLVRSLEQGQREPAPVLCRLLDEMNREPAHWQAMLKSA